MEPVLELARLRRACTHCTMETLCLPVGRDAFSVRPQDSLIRSDRSLGRGERLFRAGQALDAVYLVRDGALKTITLAKDGEEQVLGFHLPGEMLGLGALATGRHRSEAVSLTASRVCEVPFAELGQLAARAPSLQQQLLRVMGQGAARDQDHVEMLIRRQASERIALFVHGLQERYRQSGRSAVELVLPMSREEIGRFLGLALETVSRGFSRLQEDGVIAVSGRRVEILDAAALGRLVQ
jgi:CRP/FNR family transcriptional regulator